MIKNGHLIRNRILLPLTAGGLVLLLTGCCKFCDAGNCCPEQTCPDPEICPDPVTCPKTSDCDKDIVYAFDIPESQDDCPEGTTFDVVPEGEIVDPQSGGGGVVDRSGGGGVVDRDNNFVGAWCQVDCLTGNTDEDANPEIEWNYGASVVVASRTCN